MRRKNIPARDAQRVWVRALIGRFVLSGGASLGAVQVGMLRALYERGIVPDLVVGTSVGRSESGLCSDEIPLKAETWPLIIDDHQRTAQKSVETTDTPGSAKRSRAS